MMHKIAETMNNKILVLVLVLLLISFIIVANAFQLQLIEGESNLALANNISRSSSIIRAPRGLIYDVNGKKLAQNDAVFNVYVIPGEMEQDKINATLQELAKMFDVSIKDLKTKYENSGLNAQGQPVGERITLIYNIKYDKFLAYSSQVARMSGVYISSESKRVYFNGNDIAHLVGYVGDINANEVATTGLDGKASIGKDGIEKTFDQNLRGEDGLQLSEEGLNEQGTKSWIPKSYNYGDNVYLTIDIDWQRSLTKYLAENSAENGSLGGAAVVMEADTGRIRAMANYPTYDINLFARGINQKNFDKLLNDDKSPLLNRAIAMQIPTGSIFKIYMAAALQQEQVINKDSVYKSGCYELPGGYKLCEADLRNYGNLTMTQALARSSNPYFCQATVAMASKFKSDELAIRTLDEYFTKLGLGKKTGIGLPGEQPGTIPTPELKLKLQKEPWYLADLCNTAIGQGLVSATPLQVAKSTAVIINGGSIYQPQIVDRFVDADGKTVRVKTKKEGDLGVDATYLQNIKEGMRQAVEYGSATGLKGIQGNPIAKTGSSEATVVTQSGKIIKGAHSWVIGVFEYKGKEYVFVIAEQFGGRGYKSVPVAANFINCVYGNCK